MLRNDLPNLTPGPDPRPRVESGSVIKVRGSRCNICRYPSLEAITLCPVCHDVMSETTFEGVGEVFSGTVFRMPVGNYQPPISLAYVDLTDGPRMLGHVEGDIALRPGQRVNITGLNEFGDPVLRAAEATAVGAHS